MNDILSLAPQNVWKHFYSLTQVPRPSGHLEKVQAFLLEFGKSVGVEAFQDEVGNIIYRKPATPGMENRKTVILQAHMDMVPQKNKDVEHDFETDPIRPVADGGWVRAQGTTLGADDGMGVAAIMAVMEDKTLKHGPLVALITADEETGMYGYRMCRRRRPDRYLGIQRRRNRPGGRGIESDVEGFARRTFGHSDRLGTCQCQ